MQQRALDIEIARGELSRRLRRLRLDAGMTGARLATAMGISQSKISKLETGRLAPTIEDIERLVVVLHLPLETRMELLHLAETLEDRLVWQRAFSIPDTAERQAEFRMAASLSATVRVFTTMTIPGLLQTPDYISELAMLIPAEEDTRSRFVVNRLARQALLYDPSRSFRFLFSESGLRQRYGSIPVMERQLDFLADISRRPNIEIGIMPFEQAPSLIITSSCWEAFDERLLLVETFSSDIPIRDEREIRSHIEMFDSNIDAAQRGDDARALINDAAEQLRRTTGR